VKYRALVVRMAYLSVDTVGYSSFSQKEPYISQKETYTITKRNYISIKRPISSTDK